MTARLKDELVRRRAWVTDEAFNDGLALCQVVPGATMVQMCTYVGHRLGGAIGALLAAVAFILPAFTAMIVLSAAYIHWGSVPIVTTVFKGLGAVVVAIVFNACLRLWRASVRGWQGAALAGLSLVAMLLGVNLTLILAGAAALAVPLYQCFEPGTRSEATKR
jgi:chromate transporter